MVYGYRCDGKMIKGKKDSLMVSMNVLPPPDSLNESGILMKNEIMEMDKKKEKLSESVNLLKLNFFKHLAKKKLKFGNR